MGATVGVATIRGNSGRTYNIICSVPDAAAAAVTMDMTGLSATTSPDQIRVPESGYICFFGLTTAPTATGCTFYANSIPIQGANVRYAAIDADANQTLEMAFPVKQGDLLSIIEW